MTLPNLSRYYKIGYYQSSDGEVLPYLSRNTPAYRLEKEFCEDGEVAAAPSGGEVTSNYTPGIDIPSFGSNTRDSLPQLDYKLFYNHVGGKNIVRKKINIESLEPTQSDFLESKVLDIIQGDTDNMPPILVSKDNKIVDGHHRWLAMHNMGHDEIECNQVQMSYDELMEFIKDQPYISYNTVTESVILEAEYQGKTVKLGKPFRTPGAAKKFSVYVKNQKGNVVKVNFGSQEMSIKRDDPKRRKSFRARMKCDQAHDRTTPKYWACATWSKTPVSKMVDSEDFSDYANQVLNEAITPDLIRKTQLILQKMHRDAAFYKKTYGKDYMNIMHAIALVAAKNQEKLPEVG